MTVITAIPVWRAYGRIIGSEWFCFHHQGKITMPPSRPKAFVIGQLFNVVVMAVAAGMSLVQGLENASRSNPSFWTLFIAVPALLVGVIVVCRRIAKAIP